MPGIETENGQRRGRRNTHGVGLSRCHALLLATLAVGPGPGGSIIRAGLAEDYSVGTWLAKDGLPHHTVLGITQSPEGYLWVATAGGLARFDGARFKVYHSETFDGTNQTNIKAIQCDPDGVLWT
jgi:hypothetical protein